MSRKINPEILSLVKQWEGFRPGAYDDLNQDWKPGDFVLGTLTIGYGHTGQDVEPESRINKRQAHSLLVADLKRFEAAVDQAVKVALTDNQFGALVSFAFNVGVSGFRKSTLLRKLNQSDYDAVPEELMRWVHSKGRRIQGLANRRAAEAGLWSRGEFVSSRHVEPAAPSQTGGVATSGGVGAVGAGAVAEAVAGVEKAGDAMSAGTIIQIAVGVVILVGAAYALYRAWDKAGRPKPWD